MATGWGIQLTKMVGEYLVSAELCRRGLSATTFTGNVPEFDILATDKNLWTTPVQVKTSAKGDWMLRADSFLNIDYDKEKKIQKIIGKKDFQNSRLIYIFVKLVDLGKDEFYILRLQDLQRIIFKNHNEYLRKHGGRRPKSPESMHTAILSKHLSSYQNNWELFQKEINKNRKELMLK